MESVSVGLISPPWPTFRWPSVCEPSSWTFVLEPKLLGLLIDFFLDTGKTFGNKSLLQVHNLMFGDDDNDEGLAIMLLMKYLSFAGGDDAGEEQFTSSISPTLKMMDYMD